MLEKKIAHFNRLTPAEAERLAIFLEEMGETAQVIGKILRHGFESYNPHDKKKVTNRTLLAKEIGDVMLAIEDITEAEDVDNDKVTHFMVEKTRRAERFLHHQ